MISPIKLTPNMTMQTLVNAVNNSLMQIEAENRTKIIRDENGVNRVIIGKAPNGEYLIAISVNGIDVLSALGV